MSVDLGGSRGAGPLLDAALDLEAEEQDCDRTAIDVDPLNPDRVAAGGVAGNLHIAAVDALVRAEGRRLAVPHHCPVEQNTAPSR
jgi:hypothetical protein